MALICDNECFLCGRKDMPLIDARYSPSVAWPDIPCKLCIECIRQMQEDAERFFDGLDGRELARKYTERFTAIAANPIEEKQQEGQGNEPGSPERQDGSDDDDLG